VVVAFRTGPPHRVTNVFLVVLSNDRFMPEKEGPQYLKTAKDPRRGSMRPQRGLRREFMVSEC
jgi:hypothetical protein